MVSTLGALDHSRQNLWFVRLYVLVTREDYCFSCKGPPALLHRPTRRDGHPAELGPSRAKIAQRCETGSIRDDFTGSRGGCSWSSLIARGQCSRSGRRGVASAVSQELNRAT